MGSDRGNPRHATGQTAPELHIGLMWHSIFNGNLGVGALSIANAQLISDAAVRLGFAPVLHIIGSRGAHDYGLELEHPFDFTNIGLKALLNPFSDFHRTLRKCDIVFDIGGGDSFSDIYLRKRYRQTILSKVAAVAAGAPLILSPQTIGPFFAARARWMAKGVLQLSTHAFARDETSLELLHELGVGGKSSLSSDVAFALRYDPETGAKALGPSQGKLRFGLNVSSALYKLDEIPDNRIRLALDYRQLVHELMKRLCSDPGIELHLVPHVIDATNLDGKRAPHADDDYAVSRELAQQYPQSVLAPCFYSPCEAKSYIAGMDLFAGSRMHATIAAISSGTPVIPLGYSRKFNGLYDSIGYSRNIDMTSLGNADAMAQFEATFAERDALAEEAIAASAEAKRRLSHYSRFLEATLAALDVRRA